MREGSRKVRVRLASAGADGLEHADADTCMPHWLHVHNTALACIVVGMCRRMGREETKCSDIPVVVFRTVVREQTAVPIVFVQ